ncbi:MAG: hypothetical protein M3135_06340 [Actinomycetota bacterium]|nr:hypothetical protein [Actinomycetota bacterium]
MAASVYRTQKGVIFRVIEAADGAIKLELLEDDTWTAGRIGMVGLRLSPSTTELSSKQVLELPE